MKVRLGFVSNSSSASFILAIGVVTNPTKYKEWIKQFNYDEYELQYFPRLEVSLNLDKDEEYLAERAFDDTSVHLTAEQASTGDVIKVYLSGPTPEDDNGDTNYDIDLNFFNDKDIKFFTEISSPISGVEFVDKTYGAGRDG